MLQPSFVSHQPGEQGGEVIQFHVSGELTEALFEKSEGDPDGLERLGQHGLYGVPFFGGQRLPHPPRNGPGLVDALVGQYPDDFLADAAQAYPPAGHIRILLYQAHHVSGCGIVVEAQEQVRSTEMEEAQGMALDVLSPVEDPSEPGGHRRDGDPHDGVAGLYRSERMAGGTDSADAVGDAGHLVKRPADAEFLECPELHHVHPGLTHLAGIVQIDGNLRMPLDPGDRFDSQCLCHGLALLQRYPNVIDSGGSSGCSPASRAATVL